MGRRVILGCNGMSDSSATEKDLLMCFRNPPGMGHLYKDSSEYRVKIWKHTTDWEERYDDVNAAYEEYYSEDIEKENRRSYRIVNNCDKRATLDWRCKIYIQRP